MIWLFVFLAVLLVLATLHHHDESVGVRAAILTAYLFFAELFSAYFGIFGAVIALVCGIHITMYVMKYSIAQGALLFMFIQVIVYAMEWGLDKYIPIN